MNRGRRVRSGAPAAGHRAANDPGLYEDLADEWWKPRGAFAPLHWLADSRAALVPIATRSGSRLLDLACGGGLLAPRVQSKGHAHIGIDIGRSATRLSREHGITAVLGDVVHLPFPAASFDVVVAGEMLEHVTDLPGTVAEIGRVLRLGGVLVCDTLADSRRCAFWMVAVGERIGVVPCGVHDPALFVNPQRLQGLCAAVGIDLRVQGLRPSVPNVMAWLLKRREDVTMVSTGSVKMVFQGTGSKVRS
ncbi:MAG: methyltransferase domain-containing protein [Acidimicrobiales bacterium]